MILKWANLTNKILRFNGKTLKKGENTWRSLNLGNPLLNLEYLEI